jgi:uncharacterized coiled-coil protein SlyX
MNKLEQEKELARLEQNLSLINQTLEKLNKKKLETFTKIHYLKKQISK